MHRERDSRGRFIEGGRISTPTTPPTPLGTRRNIPPSQTHTPRHRTPEIQGSKIQSRESPTSSTKSVLEEKNFEPPIAGIVFFNST